MHPTLRNSELGVRFPCDLEFFVSRILDYKQAYKPKILFKTSPMIFPVL